MKTTTNIEQAELIAPVKNKKHKGPKPLTFEQHVESFWSKVSAQSPGKCLYWEGAKQPMGTNSTKSYGIVVVLGRRIEAHRFAYQLVKGLIPDWLVVAHRCDDGLCVNPEHLHLVTQKENMREAKLRNRFAVGENASSVILDAARVFLIRDLYYSALLDTSTLEKIFKIKNVGPLVRGEHWPQEPMPTSFADHDPEQLHRLNNGSAQRSVSFETVRFIHHLRGKSLPTKEIGKIVKLSANRVAVLLRPDTTAYAATNPERQKEIFAASERIQSSMWRQVSEGKLSRDLVAEIAQAITTRFGCNSIGYPDSDQEILKWGSKSSTPSVGINQRTAPRINIIRISWDQELSSRTFPAPVTAGVTIKSGQVISLSSGSWVLGCAAGLEPYIAFADSIDTDVVSSGQLLGLSCAGQFEIETAYFDNTQVYVNSSPLIAGTSASTPTATTTQSAIQAAAYKGNLTLGTLATAEDTLGFCTNGGVQNTSALSTNGGPTNSQATAYSSTGTVLPLKLLRFVTHWLPKATTSS